MLVKLADWLLDVDVATNMAHSIPQAKDHCTCGYCRNFYAATDVVMPSLRPFLQRWGIDLEGPDELCPFEPTIYEVSYIVHGKILQIGRERLQIDGAPIVLLSDAAIDFQTDRPQPYFVLRIGLFELPWLMDEDANDVISPANDPRCLERMEQKLLAYAFDEQISS